MIMGLWRLVGITTIHLYCKHIIYNSLIIYQRNIQRDVYIMNGNVLSMLLWEIEDVKTYCPNVKIMHILLQGGGALDT